MEEAEEAEPAGTTVTPVEEEEAPANNTGGTESKTVIPAEETEEMPADLPTEQDGQESSPVVPENKTDEPDGTVVPQTQQPQNPTTPQQQSQTTAQPPSEEIYFDEEEPQTSKPDNPTTAKPHNPTTAKPKVPIDDTDDEYYDLERF